MSQQHKRETVTAEQMTYSNMLTVNALVELLDERGNNTEERCARTHQGVAGQRSKQPQDSVNFIMGRTETIEAWFNWAVWLSAGTRCAAYPMGD
jgi:hypothetical protein